MTTPPMTTARVDVPKTTQDKGTKPKSKKPKAKKPKPPEYLPRRLHADNAPAPAEVPVDPMRILRLFRPYIGQLFLVVIAIIAAALLGLVQPFLLREVIDVALPDKDLTRLIWLCLGMVGVAAITGVLTVAQTWQSTRVGQTVMHDLRVGVFAHLQRQSIAFFKKTRAGEIQSRITSDIAGLQSVVTNTAANIASNVTTVVGTALAMVALNWRLALLSLALVPPGVIVTRRVALVRREVKSQRQKAYATLYSQVDESLSVNGALLTKTLGSGGARVKAFSGVSMRLVDLELRSQLAGRWRMATMQIVFAAVPAALYLAAGIPAISGGITIGTLVAFATLQATIFKPILQLLNVGADWISSMALLSRIFGYLDLPLDIKEPEHPVPLPRDSVRGEVRFSNVSYQYPDGETEALSGIDITVPPGSSLALVGETGSGKSTLGTLLVRLADPTSGQVLIDGVDLRDIASKDLAACLGVVSQETHLMHDTIAANLREARQDATDRELWIALEAAQIAELIHTLPQGLGTIVGARGHRFSGGERQRLAIARTLISNPKILILDEATSALDTETEHEVQTAIDALAKGRTTVTIAHRLSTIRHADEIVVLERGRIVERGNHDQLVEAEGYYAHLLAMGEGAAPDSTA